MENGNTRDWKGVLIKELKKLSTIPEGCRIKMQHKVALKAAEAYIKTIIEQYQFPVEIITECLKKGSTTEDYEQLFKLLCDIYKKEHGIRGCFFDSFKIHTFIIDDFLTVSDMQSATAETVENKLSVLDIMVDYCGNSEISDPLACELLKYAISECEQKGSNKMLVRSLFSLITLAIEKLKKSDTIKTDNKLTILAELSNKYHSDMLYYEGQFLDKCGLRPSLKQGELCDFLNNHEYQRQFDKADEEERNLKCYFAYSLNDVSRAMKISAWRAQDYKFVFGILRNKGIPQIDHLCLIDLISTLYMKTMLKQCIAFFSAKPEMQSEMKNFQAQLKKTLKIDLDDDFLQNFSKMFCANHTEFDNSSINTIHCENYGKFSEIMMVLPETQYWSSMLLNILKEINNLAEKNEYDSPYIRNHNEDLRLHDVVNISEIPRVSREFIKVIDHGIKVSASILDIIVTYLNISDELESYIIVLDSFIMLDSSFYMSAYFSTVPADKKSFFDLFKTDTFKLDAILAISNIEKTSISEVNALFEIVERMIDFCGHSEISPSLAYTVLSAISETYSDCDTDDGRDNMFYVRQLTLFINLAVEALCESSDIKRESKAKILESLIKSQDKDLIFYIKKLISDCNELDKSNDLLHISEKNVLDCLNDHKYMSDFCTIAESRQKRKITQHYAVNDLSTNCCYLQQDIEYVGLIVGDFVVDKQKMLVHQGNLLRVLYSRTMLERSLDNLMNQEKVKQIDFQSQVYDVQYTQVERQNINSSEAKNWKDIFMGGITKAYSKAYDGKVCDYSYKPEVIYYFEGLVQSGCSPIEMFKRCLSSNDFEANVVDSLLQIILDIYCDLGINRRHFFDSFGECEFALDEFIDITDIQLLSDRALVMLQASELMVKYCRHFEITDFLCRAILDKVGVEKDMPHVEYRKASRLLRGFFSLISLINVRLCSSKYITIEEKIETLIAVIQQYKCDLMCNIKRIADNSPNFSDNLVQQIFDCLTNHKYQIRMGDITQSEDKQFICLFGCCYNKIKVVLEDHGYSLIDCQFVVGILNEFSIETFLDDCFMSALYLYTMFVESRDALMEELCNQGEIVLEKQPCLIPEELQKSNQDDTSKEDVLSDICSRSSLECPFSQDEIISEELLGKESQEHCERSQNSPLKKGSDVGNISNSSNSDTYLEAVTLMPEQTKQLN